MRHFRQRLWRLAAGGFMLFPVVAALPAMADTNISGAVTQSYTAGSAIQTGIIVEPAPNKTQTVIPLPASDIKHMLGVVVPANNAAIVLSPSNPGQQQVLVAATGRYDLLVSNQNGPIETGDYITISSLNGVGMAAGSEQTEVVGRADANFTGTGSSLGTVKLQNHQGQTSTVILGSIPVDVSIAPNPLYQKNSAFIPSFISHFAASLAGKQVSPARIYLAIVFLGVTAFIVVSILSGSTRGSMIAVGRNPLSRRPVVRSLSVVTIVVLVIFAVGLFAVYLLLKL